jgi:dynein heavy chain 1
VALPPSLTALLAPSAALLFSRLATASGALPWQAALAQSVATRTNDWCNVVRTRGASNVLDSLPRGWERAASGGVAAPLREAVRCLAVVALLRPDALPAAVIATTKSIFSSDYVFSTPDESVRDILGYNSSEGAGVSDDGSNRSPPVLLLSTPGADAEGLVSRTRVTNPGSTVPSLSIVSLGPDSSRVSAESAIHAAESSGTWLLLRNAHLDGSWLVGALGRASTRLSAPGFRLFVAAEVPANLVAGGTTLGLSSSLPSNLLAVCDAVLVEAPAGLGAACSRALARLSSAASLHAPPEALALIAWLHSAVDERRRYVPVGWSKVYDCGDADLDAAAVTAELVYSDPRSGITTAQRFSALRRLICGALHGARLETASDTAALDSLTKAVFSPRSLEGGPLSFEYLSADFATASVSTSPLVAAPFPLPRDLSGWIQWAAQLPASMPPAVLGLPRTADALSAARAGADVLRISRALNRKK